MRQFTAGNPYHVGGARYHLNTEFSGGYRAVVTIMNDNDTKTTFEDAFIRFLSATPETLARRGSTQVPADLVNADGTINPNHHLAEEEMYRSYLGFKTGGLKPGDIIETWGKGSFYGGNPEFVDQEGIQADGVEFKIVGHDDSLAKPAFMSSISSFWDDFHKNLYVQFLAKKAGASTVSNQNGQTITLMDATGYAAKAVPGNVGDTLLVSGVPTMESYGMRFRCDSVTTTGTLIISPATATVTLGNLNFTVDGSEKSVTVTTNPANLNVTVTYNGSTTVPSTAGTYTVVATVNDPNYQGSATGTMTIAEAGSGAAAVPAMGVWGLITAMTGLGGIMAYRRKP